MASRPKIIGRATSLATSFVHAIIPRQENKTLQLQIWKQFGIDPEKCVYCGRDATDMDHFRAIVKLRKPSGHFHTPDNIVPSCGRCNQSKGGQDWKKWMLGTAPGSPKTIGVPDIEQRIERLSRFAAGTSSIQMTLETMRDEAGADLWDAYWNQLETIREKMIEADIKAREISDLLGKAFEARMAKALVENHNGATNANHP